MDPLSPTSSISSTLLADYTEGNYSLLDETLSLDTLSDTLSISPVLPDIPFPRTGFVKAAKHNLNDKLALDTNTRHIDEPATIIVKHSKLDLPAMLKPSPMAPAGFCVENWASSLVSAEPPGHIPWGDAPTTHDNEVRCLPSPKVSGESLVRSRHRVRSQVPERGIIPTAPLTIRRDRKRRAVTNTKGELIFEQEITVHPPSSGSAERWSLQIPAATMNPELVDIMLELQNLKTFFQDSNREAETSGVPVHELHLRPAQNITKAPTLILSDSRSVIPLPLSQASSDASLNATGLSSPPTRRNPAAPVTAPVAIAARRGRKMLAPLTLPPVRKQDQPSSMDIAYPGPPTAFLGIPSATSPHATPSTLAISTINVTAPRCPGGLDIQAMIENLRSQCAAFPATPNTPVDMSQQQMQDKPLDMAPSATTTEATSTEEDPSKPQGNGRAPKSGSAEDEWFFTRDLISDTNGPPDGTSNQSDVYTAPNLAKSTASFRALKNSSSSRWQVNSRSGQQSSSVVRTGRSSLSMMSKTDSADAAQRQKLRRRTMAIVGTDRLGGWSPQIPSYANVLVASPERPHPDCVTPTSSPPPSRSKHQSQMSTGSMSQPPRSILRNRKSVRFASLPNRRSQSTDYPASHVSPPFDMDQGHHVKGGRRRRLTTDEGSTRILPSALRQDKGLHSEAGKKSHNGIDPPLNLPFHDTSSTSARNPPSDSDNRTGSRRRHSTFTSGTHPAQARSARVSLDTLRQKGVQDSAPPVHTRPPPAIRSVRATTITPRKSTITMIEPVSTPPLNKPSSTPTVKPSRPCRPSVATPAERVKESYLTDKENRRSRAYTSYTPPLPPAAQRARESAACVTVTKKERSLSVDDNKHRGEAMRKRNQGSGGSRMPIPLRNILTRFK